MGSRADCNFAGLTLPVGLSPAERASRQILAKSINEQFGTKKVPCGEGSEIKVIMVTTGGEEHVFVPGKDEEWSAVAPNAIRIFVAPLGITISPGVCSPLFLNA